MSKKNFKENLSTTAEATKQMLGESVSESTLNKEDVAKYCLRLPKELLEDFRALAFLSKKTIQALVIEALSEYAEKPSNQETLKQLKK